MEESTRENAILAGVAVVLAACGIVAGVLTWTWHNVLAGVVFGVIACALYRDERYGESVRCWLARRGDGR